MSRHFKTGTVSRRVGIPPALLRMWETRYGLVTPTRGPGGQRLYTEDDVDLLRALRTLVGKGFAIGELASWPREELLATVRSERASAAPTPGILSAGPKGETVLLAVDAEGTVGVASPNAEALLGWPHGLLVGQPIWGLLVNGPPALERLVSGAGPAKQELVCGVWIRTRTGNVIPCRLEAGQRRRAAEGTAVSIALTPLFPEAPDLLTPLLDKVDGAGLLRFSGSTDQLLKEYVTTSVESHGSVFSRVWTYDPADGSLHLVASAGLSKAVATSSRSHIRLANYPFKVGVVARSGIPYVHNGLEGDRDFDRAWIKRERLESATVLPLVVDGALFGVAAHFFKKRLDAEDIGRVQAAAALCETWLSRQKRESNKPKAG